MGENFIDETHALRAGLLVGALRGVGFTATATVNRSGEWIPVIRIISPDGETFDVELLPEDS